MELLIFILGVWVGWNVNAWRIMRKLIEHPEQVIKTLEKLKEIKKEVEQEDNPACGREMRVERHGEQLYLFAKDNNEFLAQGTTLQEAIANVEKRFPDQNFKGLLSKEEADSLGIKA